MLNTASDAINPHLYLKATDASAGEAEVKSILLSYCEYTSQHQDQMAV